MKADVFIKYKIVFADYDKRNSSEMEVCFFFFRTHIFANSLCIQNVSMCDEIRNLLNVSCEKRPWCSG